MRVGIKNKSLDINDINSKLDEMLKDEPCKRESIIAAINEAREQKNAARDRMESTTDDKEFTSAAKDMEEAEKRETLKKRLLNKLDTTARMDESEYKEIVTACTSMVTAARDTARERIKKAMQEINDAFNDYYSVSDLANETLIKLDSAAHVLQSEYGNRWNSYATRYDRGNAAGVFTDDVINTQIMHNSIYCAAFKANNTAYPEKYF
jgi:hypothetical protein